MKPAILAATVLTTAIPAYAATEVVVTRAGSQPSTAGPSENFTGAVRVDSRFKGTGLARISGGTVTSNRAPEQRGTRIRSDRR